MYNNNYNNTKLPTPNNLPNNGNSYLSFASCISYACICDVVSVGADMSITEPELTARLDSLCLSMTEAALGKQDTYTHLQLVVQYAKIIA